MSDNFSIITVEAEVYLLSTDKGGRKNSVISGYNPNHKFDENSYYMGKITFNNRECFYPGESNCVTIDFIDSPRLKERLTEGYEWDITEGGSMIGKGKIIKILDKKEYKVTSQKIK